MATAILVLSAVDLLAYATLFAMASIGSSWDVRSQGKPTIEIGIVLFTIGLAIGQIVLTTLLNASK